MKNMIVYMDITIFRVHDDEWEEIMGAGQVCEFAISQVQNHLDDYLVENLEGVIENPSEVSALADRVAQGEDITYAQSKVLLSVRGYEIEEIEVY